MTGGRGEAAVDQDEEEEKKGLDRVSVEGQCDPLRLRHESDDQFSHLLSFHTSLFTLARFYFLSRSPLVVIAQSTRIGAEEGECRGKGAFL